jgi:hypothetical protein
MVKHRQSDDGRCETKARGLAVLNSPPLNKRTAFTAVGRKTLGSHGLASPRRQHSGGPDGMCLHAVREAGGCPQQGRLPDRLARPQPAPAHPRRALRSVYRRLRQSPPLLRKDSRTSSPFAQLDAGSEINRRLSRFWKANVSVRNNRAKQLRHPTLLHVLDGGECRCSRISPLRHGANDPGPPWLDFGDGGEFLLDFTGAKNSACRLPA